MRGRYLFVRNNVRRMECAGSVPRSRAALTLKRLKRKCSATNRRTFSSSSAVLRKRKERKKLHITWNRLRKTQLALTAVLDAPWLFAATRLALSPRLSAAAIGQPAASHNLCIASSRLCMTWHAPVTVLKAL